MKKILIMVITLLSFVATVKSQCLPKPPIVKSVTVKPNTAGHVTIEWEDNPAEVCTITAYEIYRYNYATTLFDLIKTVTLPAPLIYTDIAVTQPNSPQIYRMTAKAGTSGNEHSENHHTMRLDPVQEYGPCEMTATLLWTPYRNSYRDGFEIRPSEQQFNDSVKYQIVGYKTTAAAPFNIASALPLTPIISDTTITMYLEVNKYYKYCVMAILPNGEVSYSNVETALIDGTTVPIAPTYINIDSLVSYDTHNRLFFEIDSVTTMVKFLVERTDSLHKPFETIYQFSDKTLTTYDDNTCDVDKEYFYRITAHNDIYHCTNQAAARCSDTINSIILHPIYQDPNALVTWNEYYLGNVYDVDRHQKYWNTFYTNQFIDYGVSNDVGDNIYDICYRIRAVSDDSVFSISREYCLSLERIVTMPNALDPTSTRTNPITGRHGNEFGPIIGGSDLGYAYTMTIFNRWHNLIFQTEKLMDEPLSKKHFWHGESIKDSFLPEDTYLYHVRVRFKDSDKVFEQKGTVSIIYK